MDVLTQVSPALVVASTATQVMVFTALGILTISREEALSLASTLSGIDKAPAPTDTVETVEAEAPKRRGRPKKTVTTEDLPEVIEPDVLVNLGGTVVAGEKLDVEDAMTTEAQAIIAVADEPPRTGSSVVIVPTEQVEPLGEFSAEAQAILVQRFPLGARVKTGEEPGFVTKHFEGSHKCQVDVTSGVRVVDMRELSDAPPYEPDAEVVTRIQAGAYDVGFGVAWLGAGVLPAPQVMAAAEALGMPEAEARLTLGALININGFVPTQAAATAVAIWFSEQARKVVPTPPPSPPADPIVDADQIAAIRAEVKAAGVTPAQAKDLCQRHFNKDSAALLTVSEMEKFLGEVLPTWVEMQGAEDF